MHFLSRRFVSALLMSAVALLTTGCGPDAPPSKPASVSAVDDPAYRDAVAKLTSMDREAEKLFAQGKGDAAADLITQGEVIASKILGVPHPSVEAAEAAADLDQLYGRMLLSNRHFGWARLLFQKNLARWKHWEPQTPETERRLRLAQDAIAECDRLMTQ